MDKENRGNSVHSSFIIHHSSFIIHRFPLCVLCASVVENSQSRSPASRTAGRRRRRGPAQYTTCRRGGYPLGSGGMEAANKFICHARLKRSGAWWYETNSNHMLVLRCAKYNGTFDQVFRRYKNRQSEAVRTA